MRHVAGPEAGREQRARRAAKVLAVALRLEDRAGRHVQALQLAGRVTLKPPNGGWAFCSAVQIRLAQQRQPGERGARRDRLCIEPLRCSAQPGAVMARAISSGNRANCSRSRPPGRGFRGRRSDPACPSMRKNRAQRAMFSKVARCRHISIGRGLQNAARGRHVVLRKIAAALQDRKCLVEAGFVLDGRVTACTTTRSPTKRSPRQNWHGQRRRSP